jgi:hypothetical protein
MKLLIQPRRACLPLCICSLARAAVAAPFRKARPTSAYQTQVSPIARSRSANTATQQHPQRVWARLYALL